MKPFFIIGIVFSFVLFIYYVFQDYFNGYNEYIGKEGLGLWSSRRLFSIAHQSVPPPSASPPSTTPPPSASPSTTPPSDPTNSAINCDPFPGNSYEYTLYIDFNMSNAKTNLFSNLNNDILFVAYINENIEKILNDNSKNIMMDSNGVITSLRGKNNNDTDLECILLRCFFIDIDTRNYYPLISVPYAQSQSQPPAQSPSQPPGSSQMSCFVKYMTTKVLTRFISIQTTIGGKNYTFDSLRRQIYDYFINKKAMSLITLPSKQGDLIQYNQNALNNYMNEINFFQFMDNL
jgi:hypothetical protein